MDSKSIHQSLLDSAGEPKSAPRVPMSIHEHPKSDSRTAQGSPIGAHDASKSSKSGRLGRANPRGIFMERRNPPVAVEGLACALPVRTAQ